MDPLSHPSPTDLNLIEAAEALAFEQEADPAAWIRLGRLQFEPGHKPREAIESLTKALALDPASVSARFWLAMVYFNAMTDSASAKAILDEALALDPNCSEALLLMVSVRRDLDLPGFETLDMARRALAIAPDWRTPREHLIVQLLDFGQRREAAELLSELDSMNLVNPPDDPAESYFEEVVTGRSRRSHGLWLDNVLKRLGLGQRTSHVDGGDS